MGERVTISPQPTIRRPAGADTRRTYIPNYPRECDQVLTVTDDEIMATMRFMLFRMKVLVEPSGAAAAAAVFARRIPEELPSRRCGAFWRKCRSGDSGAGYLQRGNLVTASLAFIDAAPDRSSGNRGRRNSVR
jgi:cysteine synthase